MSTIRRSGTAAIVAVALCAFTAQAFALPPPPYAVVDLAHTQIGLEAAGIEEAGLQPSGSDRRDTGFAITLGWRFSPHLAAEGTFLELGEGKFDAAVQNGGSVSNAKIGVRSNGVLLSLAGTWPVHDKLSLEGRAGAYLGKTETRASGVITGPLGNQTFSNSRLESDTKAGLAAGVGAVAAFNDTWAVRAGYDYLDGAFGKDAGRVSLGVRFNWP
jgi:opacity protein-like surface antigen